MKKVLLPLVGLAAAISSEAATFNVTVPAGTKYCYVSGKFNDWGMGQPMQKDGPNHFTLDLPDITDAQVALGFKYLSGPDWKYVEKSSSGGEISNRTSASANDVVAKWAALYNPDLIEQTVRINGYDRKLRISLPAGYQTSDETYPVVYMVGVQQRYANAGSDTDGGDDFFGSNSWDAATRMEEAQLANGKGCIVVAMHCFVAESIPYPNAEFMGSGAADAFLADYLRDVVDYVSTSYRVAPGAENTTILGADLGGVLALYTAVSHPDIFGKCVSMSPMLWINREDMADLAVKSAGNQEFVLTCGSRETDVIKNDMQAIASLLNGQVSTVVFEGGIHDDKSWGASLPSLHGVFTTSGYAPSSNITLNLPQVRRRAPFADGADIASSNLAFYYSTSSSTPVAKDNTVSFALVDNYMPKSRESAATQVLIKDISSSYKNNSYWNVKNEDTGEFLKSDNTKIAFSSSKSHTTWLRVAVLEDGSIESCAASSAGFRVVAADATVTMTSIGNHHTSASVTFSGADKSFVINYGSVNSQTDMGAVTRPWTVSENCIAADIDYDYLLNSVTITETDWGVAVAPLAVEEFSAVPAVTVAGSSSKITVRITPGYTPDVSMKLNYGTASALSLTPGEDDTWHADISNLKSGIYHLTLSGSRNGTKSEAGTIAIKVLDNLRMNTPVVSVNAYDGVDWETTNRYKANFHTHTSQSFDTSIPTHEVVDLYHQAGYSILALTDHDFNPYPWSLFDLFNPDAESRDHEQLGMLTIPANELSKDNRNSWSEATGGEFNHHNDFFTGRKGQEFASLRESYAYTQALGGMQLINHPGQYWSLDKTYTAGEKNSPQWHAENFQTYSSLIGLEVYNQGNRRPNDRILWDQILEITMPDRPVWGYSNDDTHTREQYFRNYQYMLMPDLTVESLKDAMANGREYFSYEYTGSGEAKAPRINSIKVDDAAKTITIDTDADDVSWIYSTDKPSSGTAGSRKSTVVGLGKSFDFTGYQGRYVRALIKNQYGETCTQPFGFTDAPVSGFNTPVAIAGHSFTMTPNPAEDVVTIKAPDEIKSITIHSLKGQQMISINGNSDEITINVSDLIPGTYLVTVAYGEKAETQKLMVR